METSPVNPKLTERKHISSCGLCYRTNFNSRTLLYRHYAGVHFTENLKQYVNFAKLSCKICGQDLYKLENLYAHIGATHNKVEDFLHPSLHIPKRQSFFCNECNLCQGQFSNLGTLLKHMSTNHYENEFEQFFNKHKMTCNICNSKFGSTLTGIIHVINVHDKMKKLIQNSRRVRVRSMGVIEGEVLN